MQITIGSDVLGTDGKLGEVSAMLVNAERTGIDAILIREPGPTPGERILPLALATLLADAENGAIHLDLDEGGLQALEDSSSIAVRLGGMISVGTRVIDQFGRKVGELSEFRVESTSGQLTQISLREGIVFRDETDLPVWLVERLSTEGVLLNVSREIAACLVKGRASAMAS